MRKVIGIGAGGHGRVVADILRGQAEIIGFTDPNPKLHGTKIDAIPVLGDDSILPEYREAFLFMGIGGVGNNRPRARVFEKLTETGFRFVNAIHRTATVAESVTLASGVSVMAGAVLNPGVSVGSDAIINTGAIVDHDCKIGDHVHIAPGAVLSGGVTVGNLAHIGTGAVVRQGISIGESAVIGAGAVVVKDVPAGITVVGVPARPRA